MSLAERVFHGTRPLGLPADVVLWCVAGLARLFSAWHSMGGGSEVLTGGGEEAALAV